MIARILKRGAGVLAMLVFSLTPVATVSAATGTGAANLSMSGGGSYTTGSSFTVTVSASSSVDIYGVDASFSFDASKLRCNSVNGDGSAFANSYQGSCGNGVVTIGRGTQGTAVRGGKVASVNFTALATGTAAFKAVAATEIDDANVSNVCNSTCAAGATLGSVTLTAPVETGRGADPAPTTPAPTTKNTPTNNANNKTATNNSTATTDGEVAGDETKAAETAKTEDDKKKDDSKKSDDKKDDEKKTSSSAWFWPVALVAVIAGYVAARTMRSRAAAKAAADAEAAAAAKAASDKPKNKKNKK